MFSATKGLALIFWLSVQYSLQNLIKQTYFLTGIFSHGDFLKVAHYGVAN